MQLFTQIDTLLEAERLRIPGGPKGWRPERLILRDWWHWRDQEFGFAHGRLALTGQNAGGKSSLLALTLPLLLDGRMDPIRLDPAQSRDRHIEYYLLGDASNDAGNAFYYEGRIGYIALEFYHVERNEYLTIGRGFQASRHSARPVPDHWGFFVFNGSRIGRGWDLRGGDGTCLGRRELQLHLGDGGRITTDLAEYRREVNTRLFGFEGDGFHDLIEILLQARRPKLGEQTGPEKVCDLLRRALPPVPEERLRRVSEVVQHLQTYQQNLADVAVKQAALARVDEALWNVAVALLHEAYQAYRSTQGTHGAASRERRRFESLLAETEALLTQLETAALARTEEWTALSTEVEELRQREGSDLQERLAEKIEAQQRAEADLRVAADDLERLLEQRGRRSAAATAEEQTFARECRDLALQMERLERESRDLLWLEAEDELRDARGATLQLAVVDPADVIMGAEVRSSLAGIADELAPQFQRAATLSEAVEAADRAAIPLRERVEGIRGTLVSLSEQRQGVEENLEAAAFDWLDQLTAWAANVPVLAPAPSIIEGIARQVEHLTLYPASPRAILAPFYHADQERRTALQAAEGALAEREQQQGVALRQAEAALHAALADTGEPSRSPIRAAARKALRDAAPPLFRVVRFKADVPAAVGARVEAALQEAGWLDLLVEQRLSGTAFDAILRAAPRQGGSLLAILEPEAGAPLYVRDALATIGWGEGEGDYWIAPDGRWQNGPAIGQVEPWAPQQPELIGEANRAAAQTRRVRTAQEQVEVVQAAIALLAAERTRLTEDGKALTLAMAGLEAIPWAPILQLQAALDAVAQQEDRNERELASARVQLEAAEALVRRQQTELDQARQDLPGAFQGTARQYLDRQFRFTGLAQSLATLGRRHAQLLSIRDRYQVAKAEEADTAQGETRVRTERERREQERVRAVQAVRVLQELCQDPNLLRQAERLRWCKERILTLDRENITAIGEQNGLAERSRTQSAEIERRTGEEEELRKATEAALDRLRQSLRRHPRIEPYLAELDQLGPITVGPRLPRPELDGDPSDLVTKAAVELSDRLRQEEDHLRDYRPQPTADRYGVSLFHLGAPVTATKLGERLAAESARYGDLIQEEQRRLFEEIIFAQMLDELIRLMAEAHLFREKIAQRLENLPLSNGEVLSLRLSIKPEEEEPGARIARALKESQSAGYMPEEQKRRLVDLIKAEVDRLQADGSLSYQEAVVSALDYRNWFQFHLLSKMEGQPPTVIRNRGFGQRSTSAKAMALAVPIIAAVAARYDAARPDAPRVIGLDEAFAGFDANNQSIYLKYLSGLGLSWIITIPEELPYSDELSAVMAYRMELRGTLHTGLPILWNGQTTWEPLTELMGG